MLADALGGEDPTGTMSRAHAEIAHLVRRLGVLLRELPPDGRGPHRCRRSSDGSSTASYAILRLHFVQEDEAYFSRVEEDPAKGPLTLGSSRRLRQSPRMMQALVLPGWQQAPELRDVPVPEPGPGRHSIRVAGAGACHSDLHLMEFPPGALPFDPPFILGHENTGWVEAIAPGTPSSRSATRSPSTDRGVVGTAAAAS